MSKIRIRDAKVRDIGLFRKLWKEFLAENEKNHAIVACTDKNVTVSEGNFTSYVEGNAVGLALFVGDYAVLMAGEMFTPMEYNCGKVAVLWGLYVREDKRKTGVATALIEEAKKRIKAAGFNAVITAFGIKNEEAGKLALKEEAQPILLTSVISLG